MSEDLKLAAKKGAYWLDLVYPEWTGSIQIDQLEMQSMERCILGWVAGGYMEFESWLARGLPLSVSANIFLIDHGFDISVDHVDSPPWQELREAWIEQIEERL